MALEDPSQTQDQSTKHQRVFYLAQPDAEIIPLARAPVQ
jgi:hypothetical protein